MSVAEQVHVCPILMRTVVWSNGECTEKCGAEDCPLKDLYELENDKEQSTFI